MLLSNILAQLTLYTIIVLTSGTGILQIRYLTFDTRGLQSNGLGCDLFGNPCDPIIRICLRFMNTNSAFNCRSQGVTTPIIIENLNNINLVQFGSVIGDTTNPVSYATDNLFDGNFEIFIEADDDDIFFDDDIDRVYIRETVASGSSSRFIRAFGRRSVSPAFATIRYMLTCDPDYFGDDCNSRNTTVVATGTDTDFIRIEDFKYYILAGGSIFVLIILVGSVMICNAYIYTLIKLTKKMSLTRESSP